MIAAAVVVVVVFLVAGRAKSKREGLDPGTYQVVKASVEQRGTRPRPKPTQVTFPRPLTNLKHRVFEGTEPKPDEGQTISFAVDDPGLCDTTITFVDEDTEKAIEAPCDGTRVPSIEKWKDDAPFLHAPVELVVPARLLRIVIPYPLARTVSFDIESASAGGFTRLELLARIGELYQHIYSEERLTALSPPKKVTAGGNITKTSGTFGICCHDLPDLVLEGVQLTKDATGSRVAWLHIGS